jgi:hypothetical protein
MTVNDRTARRRSSTDQGRGQEDAAGKERQETLRKARQADIACRAPRDQRGALATDARPKNSSLLIWQLFRFHIQSGLLVV